MALPPHELDLVFEDIDTIDQKISVAIEEAKRSYTEQEGSIKESPGLAGPTPAQAARMAFIESLKG
ncbi:hypothetical protein [Gimesia sp.]|uniref:hypothetical protein n=1 Tax=Gimesia sp. TaxID=2024833 RepID=UPI000C4AFC7F|nr:hypothetical protein [Gimesia sp.]MAX40052.1 hypothetical protein [Gimesia sp.]HAH47938.1 hypothetical protein [Planctomycetaceae bacterium]HBL42711.1 hypothetical protein [Planctomycetaceae bacterium]|tara:strand:+ start:820 stop:1017 length:198 start_codon:yes stop_codon:yes gene_type:complete